MLKFFHFGRVKTIYNTLPFKSLGLFNIFEINFLCSPRLHLFDQQYEKNSNIMTFISIFKNVIYCCDLKRIYLGLNAVLTALVL